MKTQLSKSARERARYTEEYKEQAAIAAASSAWAMRLILDAPLVSAALRMALSQRRPARSLILHSDHRGSQSAGTAYRRVLAQHGLVPSMSRPGNCLCPALPGFPDSRLIQSAFGESILYHPRNSLNPRFLSFGRHSESIREQMPASTAGADSPARPGRARSRLRAGRREVPATPRSAAAPAAPG